jgi:hypothetical protein
VVPESNQIDPLHYLAQLQVEHHQGTHHFGSSYTAFTLLLRNTWILSEKASWSLNLPFSLTFGFDQNL